MRVPARLVTDEATHNGESPSSARDEKPGDEATSGELDGRRLQEIAERGTFPEVERALERNAASFELLAESKLFSSPQLAVDEPSRLVWRRYYPDLLAAFEAAHGPIASSYFCKHVVAAAALTTRPGGEMELHLVNNALTTDTLEVGALLSHCEQLSYDASELLEGHPLRITLRRLYSIVTNLLDMLDRNVFEGVEVNHQKSELESANEYLVRWARHRALVHYFVGMLIGTVCVAVLGGASGIALDRVDISSFSLTIFLGSLVAGAMGAVVSVMTRMTRGRLVLKHDARRTETLFLGGFRPLIGAIFGIALYFIVGGGFVPVEQPTEAREFLFFSGMAFIAGFSERWAQDMLVYSRRGLVEPDAAQETVPEERPDAGVGG